jgi:hypothetical protein
MDGVPIPRGDISLMLLGVELALLLPLLQGISLQVSSFQSELRESTCKAQCGIMWSCPISQTLTSANKYHKYQHGRRLEKVGSLSAVCSVSSTQSWQLRHSVEGAWMVQSDHRQDHRSYAAKCGQLRT